MATADEADGLVTVITGESTSERLTGAECSSPVGLCTTGTMSGTINGSYSSVATELTPSSVPGVMYVRATTEVTTDDGKLRIEEHAVVNASPQGFGEHTSLGHITGGTGRWWGASGYIHAVGESKDGGNRSTLSGKLRLRRAAP